MVPPLRLHYLLKWSKKRDTRTVQAHETFWAYAAAAFNLLITCHGLNPYKNCSIPLSIKEFVL